MTLQLLLDLASFLGGAALAAGIIALSILLSPWKRVLV